MAAARRVALGDLVSAIICPTLDVSAFFDTIGRSDNWCREVETLGLRKEGDQMPRK